MDARLPVDLRKVGVDAIRDALRAQWASESMDEHAVIRARTHNLIVYTTAGQQAVQDTIARIAALTFERPGRVIVVQADPEGDPALDAWVTVYCGVRGHRQVCGEMIVLAVGGEVRREALSTVIGLLAPDLPTFLYWMGLPEAGDYLFAALAAECDRLIVDSDALPDPSVGLRQIGSLSGVRLGDLAWARLTPWRLLLAQLWDVFRLREALDHIRTLDVRYVADAGSRDSARALLLVGWLADRLGWEVTSASVASTGEHVVTWRKECWGGKVGLVKTFHQQIPPGEIVEIGLQAGRSSPFVMVRLQLSPDRGCADVEINGASLTPEWHGSAFKPVDTSAALAEELDLCYDPYYERALRRAVEIVSVAHS